jgi:hypothetical protein
MFKSITVSRLLVLISSVSLFYSLKSLFFYFFVQSTKKINLDDLDTLLSKLRNVGLKDIDSL